MPALLVIRHAEPAVRGVLLGQSDPPLSERGVQQASQLAGSLPADHLVYSSPLERARRTAAIIASKEPIIESKFTELSYGDWDALSWTEIEHKWPLIASKKMTSWEEITPPNGETWDSLRQRVTLGLRPILEARKPAIIVAHEAVNAVIAEALRGIAIQSYRQQYCETVRYDL